MLEVVEGLLGAMEKGGDMLSMLRVVEGSLACSIGFSQILARILVARFSFTANTKLIDATVWFHDTNRISGSLLPICQK